MTLFNLANQVRENIALGNIPISTHVPRTTMIEIPTWFGRGIKTVPQRTMGFWAGFAQDVPEPFDPADYNTYYISMDGIFAVAPFHPTQIVLYHLPTLEVLRCESMWKKGLQAMLNPTNCPPGLCLNPV